MKKIVWILCLLLLPLTSWAAPAWRITELNMNELNRPTGAFCYEDALFTTNSGSNTAKADGFVLRYTLENRTESRFLDGKLYNPQGLVIVRNYMLVIDQNLNGGGKPGLVWADIRQNKVLATAEVPDAISLKSVVALNSSNYIVTDKGGGRLFEAIIDSDDKIDIKSWVLSIGEASGVCLHDGFIYTAGSALDEKNQQIKSGSIYQIDPLTTVTQRFVTLTQTATGYLNAITGHRGYLFVGDWSGQNDQETAGIYVISSSAKRRVAKIDVAPGVTDIAAWGDALYLTVPGQNKIIRVEVDFESLGR